MKKNVAKMRTHCSLLAFANEGSAGASSENYFRNRLRGAMKLIIAIIRPEKLADVKRSLFQVGVTGMTLSRVSGHGGERDVVQQYRGDTVVLEFHEKVRIEMACSEEFVERTIEAICEGARTGSVGDGKIFVMPLDRTVRIRTGERDNDALTAVNADEIMRMTQMEMPIPRLEDL